MKQSKIIDTLEMYHPMVGANCRGGRTTDAKGLLKRGAGSRASVGSRGEVGMRRRGTPDIPRFGALRRDNTPSPAEFSWMVDSTMLLLELCGEEGGWPRLGLLLLLGVAMQWLVLCLPLYLTSHIVSL